MIRRYLTLVSFDEALGIMKDSFPSPGITECIPLEDAIGRTTAEPVFASYSIPGADLAAMDGIAVQSSDTFGASDRFPAIIEDYVPVNTGQPVPPRYDAVIMIEDVWIDGGECRIRKPAFSGQFIRPAGEAIRNGELILPKGHLVRVYDIGGLATCGITNLKVHSACVGFIPTGDELIPAGARPGPGYVVESNSYFARNFFSGMGATFHRYPIVPDDPERLSDILYRAVAENDLVIISAGSSAGTTDFTEEVISSSGALLFHGVAMKPGTPLMLGSIEGKPVFGVPGYPVATACTIREFAGRLLEWWGLAPFLSFPLKARLSTTLSSDLGYEEFVSVSVGKVAGLYHAVPHSRGNGAQMSVIRSNGYFIIPAPSEGIEAGKEVLIHLMTPPSGLDRVLLVMGTRDACTYHLANCIANQNLALHICASRDLNALSALKEGYCHAASISLPRIESWQNLDLFNSIKELNLVRVTMAEVELGLASRNGLHIDDLPNIRFLNRIRGSPARALADEMLRRNGIRPEHVHGYPDQAKSDEGITSAITRRKADAGICRNESARKAGLAWEPLGFESFELVFPMTQGENPIMAKVIQTLRSEEYGEALVLLTGYDKKRTGHMQILTPQTFQKDLMKAPSDSDSSVNFN